MEEKRHSKLLSELDSFGFVCQESDSVFVDGEIGSGFGSDYHMDLRHCFVRSLSIRVRVVGIEPTRLKDTGF